MLNFLDNYTLIKGKAAFGVELVFNTKDNYTLIALELTRAKDALEITRRFVDISLENLAKENTKKLPLYISLGGKGVIHKKLKFDEYSTDQELLNQVLPNATLKDFFIQKTLLTSHECWVSVIRKDVLDKLISEIEALNLFAIQLYLGPFGLEHCIQLLDRQILLSTSHELLIENQNIIQLDSLGSVSGGEEYNIEGELVNSHELIAFGSGLNHFLPSSKLISIHADKVTQQREEYYHKNKYVAVGFSMVILFFTVAVVNLLLLDNYKETYNELQYQVSSKKQYVDELEVLKADLQIKEQFVESSGVTQASKIAYYADQIALGLPSSIRLNQMFINPLEKLINKAEDIQFNYKKIKVTGTVNRSIELNDWIKKLKQCEWTKEVRIINFVQDNLNTAANFEIEINISK